MAEKDNETGDDVNLEMPSLGFGSKRRKRKAEATEPETGESTAAGKFVPPPSSEVAAAPAAEPSPSVPHSFRPPGEEDDGPLYADDVEDTAVLSATEEPKPAKAPKPPKPPKPRREFNLPEVNSMTVSVLTGILIGLIACGLTYAGLQGCESIKGTSSCGGPGFFLLVAILIMLVVIGSFIMKAFRVTDPASTSFLAVGLLAVIVLLFLVDVIFDWWMFIAIPVIGAATFALSHWVTATFIEPADGTRPASEPADD
jgi:hypothetical protein